jgi:mRNA interferase RelE/StbE
VPAPDLPYRLLVSRTAARQIAEQLTETVAAAVFNFVTSDLLAAPRRVGKPLRGDLAPHFAARRGEYRVVYIVDDDARTVTVIDVRHRRDVYRRR